MTSGALPSLPASAGTGECGGRGRTPAAGRAGALQERRLLADVRTNHVAASPIATARTAQVSGSGRIVEAYQ